jgi:hypothetical protein
MRFSKHGNHRLTKRFISLMDAIDKASIDELQTAALEFGDWDCEDKEEYVQAEGLWYYVCKRIDRLQGIGGGK